MNNLPGVNDMPSYLHGINYLLEINHLLCYKLPALVELIRGYFDITHTPAVNYLLILNAAR